MRLRFCSLSLSLSLSHTHTANRLSQNNINVILHDVVHRLNQGVLYSQNLTRIHRIGTNLILLTPMKSAALPASIFTKLTCSAAVRGDHLCRLSAQLVEKYGERAQLGTDVLLSITAKLALTDNFVKSSYAEFHENPTNNLIADKRMDGCGLP